MILMAELTVEEKHSLLKKHRSGSAKIRTEFLKNGGVLKGGQGRGKEPEPLCACHNRNPCPIDIELGL